MDTSKPSAILIRGPHALHQSARRDLGELTCVLCALELCGYLERALLPLNAAARTSYHHDANDTVLNLALPQTNLAFCRRRTG